jgi:sporulation protein YlmC with PRC-barrel domain
MQVTLTGRERKIPFKEFMKVKILLGKKIATTRSRKVADVGDVFLVEKTKFVVVEEGRQELNRVAKFFFTEEGFDSTEEFIAYWKDLHRKKYNPAQVVHYHEFKKL